MKYGIALIIFGLTQLSVAMNQPPLPSLPPPSLAVELANIQQAVELLQKHNKEAEIRLLACSYAASAHPALWQLHAHLEETRAFVTNDKDLLDRAEEKLTAVRKFVATSTPPHKHALDPAPASNSPALCARCKKRKPQKEKNNWDMRPYTPPIRKRAAASGTSLKESDAS